MAMINYFLAALVANLGIACGAALGRIAEEEIKPGKMYIRVFKDLVLVLILSAVMSIFMVDMWINVAVVIVILLFLLYFDVIRINNRTCLIIKGVLHNTNIIKTAIVYGLLGFAFYLSYKHISIFVITASLIFLYGLPKGTLDYERKWKIILTSSSFFIISALLYLS